MSKPIKATIEINLVPFTVPAFATVTLATRNVDGDPNTVQMRIQDLSPEMLADLCDDFQRTIFKNAQKDMPPTHDAIEVRHNRSDAVLRYFQRFEDDLGPLNPSLEQCQNALRDVCLIAGGGGPSHNKGWEK